MKLSKHLYIPKNELIEGKNYICHARNFTVGQWNGKVFLYIREKFGDTFLDSEEHWDEGPPHGTVFPIKLINASDILQQAYNKNLESNDE